jgi:hypothetical protein
MYEMGMMYWLEKAETELEYSRAIKNQGDCVSFVNTAR